MLSAEARAQICYDIEFRLEEIANLSESLAENFATLRALNAAIEQDDNMRLRLVDAAQGEKGEGECPSEARATLRVIHTGTNGA